MTAVMAACSSDEDVANGEQRSDGKVPVRLRIHVAGQSNTSSANTRADWTDTNATDDEMMNIWTVYCVDNDPSSDRYGKLVFIHICMPVNDNREIDDLVYLPKGKYAFYSFANIHPTESNSLMGIAYDPKKLRPVNRDGRLGDEVEFYYGYDANNIWRDFFEISDDNTNKGVVYDMKWVESEESDTYVYKYHDIDTDSGNDYGMYSSQVWGVDGFLGNGLDPTATNCFKSKGIPMSNYQEVEIAAGAVIDLIVVRMVAKIEVQLYNESNSPITVKSATLTDVTEDGSGQICLFPNLNNVGTGHEHEMAYTHKDILPHISDEAMVDGFTYTPATAVTVPAHYDYETNNSNPVHKITFYVNESKAPTNASGLFYLTLGIENGDGEVEYHHALINQKGSTTTDDNAWDYIARNDYRIIPVILTDWQFRIEPLAYAPIAGYPAKTVGSDGLSATFSTGGPIILQPFVKKTNDTTWRDFTDEEVTFVSVSWKNSNGTDVSGTGKIFEQPLTYDTTTKCIYGVLNNNLGSGTYKTAVTVNVKLGPESDQYNYSFTCDVILQK